MGESLLADVSILLRMMSWPGNLAFYLRVKFSLNTYHGLMPFLPKGNNQLVIPYPFILCSATPHCPKFCCKIICSDNIVCLLTTVFNVHTVLYYLKLSTEKYLQRDTYELCTKKYLLSYLKVKVN